MTKLKFGIIGAMDIEIELLASRMSGLKKIEYINLVFYEGKLCGKKVVIVKSGIGKVNAALCCQILIDKFNVTNVINTGIAGGMDKRLRILDTVVSTECVYHDADTTFFKDPICTIPEMPTFYKADKNMTSIAMSYKNAEYLTNDEENLTKNMTENMTGAKYDIYEGRIASGDQFICTKEGKEKIMTNCNPMCVEMEGCAIAHVCYVNQIPFVIIRSISDNADENVTTDYTFNRGSAAQVSANIVCHILSKI